MNPRFDLFVDTVRADPPPSISCSRRRLGESSDVLSRLKGSPSVTSGSTGGDDLAGESPGAPNDAREDGSECIQFAKGSLFSAVLACCDWGEGYNAAAAGGGQEGRVNQEHYITKKIKGTLYMWGLSIVSVCSSRVYRH